VLFLHGNAGNISHRLDRINIFHTLGVSSLLIDYRGFGNSTGQPSEQGTYRDARAAYDYLIQERGISPRQIVIYGESLGTAISVDLASKVPCGGVVLEAAFTSVPDVAQKMFPFLPVRPFVRNRYDSLSKISKIKAPLLIFHSRADEMFSMQHAERLLAAASQPKQLVELSGGHCDSYVVSADIYHAALKELLNGLK
jgi:pimeloyl-ACP methyl ester carboxylesterase